MDKAGCVGMKIRIGQWFDSRRLCRENAIIGRRVAEEQWHKVFLWTPTNISMEPRWLPDHRWLESAYRKVIWHDWTERDHPEVAAIDVPAVPLTHHGYRIHWRPKESAPLDFPKEADIQEISRDMEIVG